MDIGMGTPLMDNLVRLRQLCQEFDIGAYMDGIEPSGMSEKDALGWAVQIVPASRPCST